jgi:hypothetical protein
MPVLRPAHLLKAEAVPRVRAVAGVAAPAASAVEGLAVEEASSAVRAAAGAAVA